MDCYITCRLLHPLLVLPSFVMHTCKWLAVFPFVLAWWVATSIAVAMASREETLRAAAKASARGVERHEYRHEDRIDLTRHLLNQLGRWRSLGLEAAMAHDIVVEFLQALSLTAGQYSPMQILLQSHLNFYGKDLGLIKFS